MASNPPGKCCMLASFHKGTPKGTFQEIYGLDTYVAGAEAKETRVLVILTDIYGHKFNNTMLVADEMAKCNYTVYVPDILMADPVTADCVDFPAWLSRHSNETTRPTVDGFLGKLRAQVGKDTFVGVIGYCFGAKYAIQNLSQNGYATAGAIAHPSFVTVEEVAAITKPLVISAAEVDTIFPAELRHKTEEILLENKVRYQLTLFSGVEHGFAIKGDISNLVVKYAKEKSLADFTAWFAQF